MSSLTTTASHSCCAWVRSEGDGFTRRRRCWEWGVEPAKSWTEKEQFMTSMIQKCPKCLLNRWTFQSLHVQPAILRGNTFVLGIAGIDMTNSSSLVGKIRLVGKIHQALNKPTSVVEGYRAARVRWCGREIGITNQHQPIIIVAEDFPTIVITNRNCNDNQP